MKRMQPDLTQRVCCPACQSLATFSLGPDGLGIFPWLHRADPAQRVCLACGRAFTLAGEATGNRAVIALSTFEDS